MKKFMLAAVQACSRTISFSHNAFRRRKAPFGALPLFALILLATPAWSGPAEIAGVYVKCPAKDAAACPQLSDEFRRLFPNSQNSPFMMIRKDGRGYVAPDDLLTIDFTWQLQGDDLILLKMDDQKKTRAEYRIIGKQLVNAKTNETYLMSVADSEWNTEPVPFKQKSKSKSGGAK